MPADRPRGGRRADEARWQAHVERTLYPKLRAAGAFVSIAPSGEPDAKFCLELGAAIVLGKPILVVAPPGTRVSPGLRRVAHAVLEGVDPLSEAGGETLLAFIAEFAGQDAPDAR